jgi:hypothetical protein
MKSKPKEQKKADENSSKFKSRFAKNANYDADQDEPDSRMGAGSFANMPENPIFSDYVMPQYRDGIVNSFSAGVEELSGINENRRKK